MAAAAKPILSPTLDGKIRPVYWRSFMPGMNFESQADQDDVWVAEQRKTAEEVGLLEQRCTAMGYLVALHNNGRLGDTSELIQFFEKIARASSGSEKWQARDDALCAIAYLKDKDQRPHPAAIKRLIELANDADFHGRRDALAALAKTGDPAALDLLVAGVVEFGGMDLGQGISRIDSPCQDKANRLIHTLQSSPLRRNQLDLGALLCALSPPYKPPTHRPEIEDALIEAARHPDNQNMRMSDILAGLLIACEAGDAEQAGHRIDAYERDHNVPSDELHNLRLQVGGPAISRILQSNLEVHFQRPIERLNDNTLIGWKEALDKARTGFSVRLWMSFTVFGIGVVLLGASSIKLLLPGNTADTNTLTTFAAGLGTMLLIIYTGPLKDIRQSVSDLATTNAVFIAYLHRVLEISHTFSFHYLHGQITFEEMAKSSNLIKEAMENTVRSLNMTAIDSSEDVIVRAMTFAADKLKKV